MTRELELELLLDSPDTSDYTFDTLETPAHPSMTRESNVMMDDASMQCEVSPLLDASPSLQSAQGDGMRMMLESRYYEAKNRANVDEFVKIVSLIEDDQEETWMQVIKCKCLKFIFENHVTSKRYEEAISCTNSIVETKIPRVQSQRIINAILDAVEREWDASMSWCVFVVTLADCIMSSLNQKRDAVQSLLIF
jgi:hypothetical protein